MHRVKRVVSEPLGQVLRFLCLLQKVAVHRGSPSAKPAASRPKTPGQHVCPANLLPTFKQALLPIGLWHECCWCQTLLMVAGEVSYAVTLLVAAGCYHSLFGNANYFQGLVKHYPSIFDLERAYMLLGRPVGLLRRARERRIFREAFYSSFERPFHQLGRTTFQATTPSKNS